MRATKHLLDNHRKIKSLAHSLLKRNKGSIISSRNVRKYANFFRQLIPTIILQVIITMQTTFIARHKAFLEAKLGLTHASIVQIKEMHIFCA